MSFELTENGCMVLVDPRVDDSQVPLGMTIITEVAKQILPDQGDDQTSNATERNVISVSSDSIGDGHALNCPERLERFQVVQQQLLTRSQSSAHFARQSAPRRIDKKQTSVAGLKRHRPMLRASQRV